MSHVLDLSQSKQNYPSLNACLSLAHGPNSRPQIPILQSSMFHLTLLNSISAWQLSRSSWFIQVDCFTALRKPDSKRLVTLCFHSSLKYFYIPPRLRLQTTLSTLLLRTLQWVACSTCVPKGEIATSYVHLLKAAIDTWHLSWSITFPSPVFYTRSCVNRFLIIIWFAGTNPYLSCAYPTYAIPDVWLFLEWKKQPSEAHTVWPENSLLNRWLSMSFLGLSLRCRWSGPL